MLEKLLRLNSILLEEMPEYKTQGEGFPKDIVNQKRLLRSLMNIRPPMELKAEFIALQDEFLQGEVAEKGIVDISQMEKSSKYPNIYLWQGDITRLQVDGIVNAANSKLLGCFVPCHGCIDNIIHYIAGLQLRQHCNEIMIAQGHDEETAVAKITPAYNLPSNYVIHTVGPIIYVELREKDCELLRDCYVSCLKIAIENNLKTIAFCCISTGEFHFPNNRAAEIAVKTVTELLQATNSNIEVIFNVFKDEDYKLYKGLLG